MSDLSKRTREAMKDKAHRMVGADPAAPVDASGYRPPEPLDADVQTGLKPIGRQARKAGGKVEGDYAKARMDRTPRKGPKKSHYADGGETGAEVPTQRFGFSSGPSRLSKMAGLKRGGRAHRDMGGVAEALSPAYMLAKNPKALKAISPIANLKTGGKALADQQGTPITGGRVARKSGGKTFIKDAIKHPGALHEELHVKKGEKIPQKKLEKAEHSDNPKLRKRAQFAEELKGIREGRKDGGRAKGKTTINIVIGAGKDAQPMPPPMPPMPPPRPPVPPPMPAGPPTGAMPPLPPNMGAPVPMAGTAVPRKRGGRTYRQPDAGSGSGLGRLEKAEDAKRG